MAKLKLPQSYGERKKAAVFIRHTLSRCKLGNVWLIQQLEMEGFFIKPPQVCDALALRSQFPKTDEFLARAEQICVKYEQSCFAIPQSER